MNYQGIDLSRYLHQRQFHIVRCSVDAVGMAARYKPAAEEAGAEQEQEQDESAGRAARRRQFAFCGSDRSGHRRRKLAEMQARDVFVQSIKAVRRSRANVSVVAKNGAERCSSQTTGADGHCIPALDVATNERQPVVFWWRKRRGCLLPADQQLNNVGWISHASTLPGEQAPTDPRTLSSYCSQAAACRPEDTFNISI